MRAVAVLREARAGPEGLVTGHATKRAGRLLTLHRALYDAVLVDVKRAGRRAPEDLGVQAVAGGQSGVLRADLSEHLWLALQAGCRSGRIFPCLSGWAAGGLAGVGLAARACWARRCSSWPASGRARARSPVRAAGPTSGRAGRQRRAARAGGALP